MVFRDNQGASGGAGGGSSIPTPENDVFQTSSATTATSFALTAQVSGTGSVSATSGPAAVTGGITACSNAGGVACQAGYSIGAAAAVTLTATAPAGQTFTGWNGDCSDTEPTCTVTMDMPRFVTATFAAMPVAVPTLGQWGLMLLGLLAAGLGGRGLRRARDV
ncbi:IPTL-CTERM sorting domain-containing protein [Ottowia sp. GY511]|nr:IPTL-CTERM sorting domain-containing protein [Ottowia sp. GY511]